jgi:hypothetical protein
VFSTLAINRADRRLMDFVPLDMVKVQDAQARPSTTMNRIKTKSGLPDRHHDDFRPAPNKSRKLADFH